MAPPVFRNLRRSIKDLRTFEFMNATPAASFNQGSGELRIIRTDRRAEPLGTIGQLRGEALGAGDGAIIPPEEISQKNFSGLSDDLAVISALAEAFSDNSSGVLQHRRPPSQM
jgi:hypothetical protein